MYTSYNSYMSKISETVLECFKNALLEIMNEIGFHDTEISHQCEERDYSILLTIGFTGRVHGYLMIQSDMDSAKEFVSFLSAYVGMEIDENDFGEYHKSTFCEIANQISGRTTIHLSEIGLNSDITPPSIIIGSSIYTSISDFDVSETYYLSDAFGKLKIFIGLNIS